MNLIGRIELPDHKGPGGFDHAAVDSKAGKLYVAHTGNDAVDVINCEEDRYLRSIAGLKGVAGALVSEELGMVFTSNRGEDTVGIIDPHYYGNVVKVKVGVRPNGLACAARRGLLLAANVGNPDVPGSHTASVVDIERREMIQSVPMPGRTRWTVFDEANDCFYVNIAKPFQIAVLDAAEPSEIARTMDIPAEGPHGLDLDASTGRLFCACDAGRLFALNAASGQILMSAELSGVPDVIFFNEARKHLYVAVGDPGVIDLFETDSLQRINVIATGKGAHTLAFDETRNKVYAFLPEMHAAQVFVDA